MTPIYEASQSKERIVDAFPATVLSFFCGKASAVLGRQVVHCQIRAGVTSWNGQEIALSCLVIFNPLFSWKNKNDHPLVCQPSQRAVFASGHDHGLLQVRLWVCRATTCDQPVEHRPSRHLQRLRRWCLLDLCGYEAVVYHLAGQYLKSDKYGNIVDPCLQLNKVLYIFPMNLHCYFFVGSWMNWAI